LILTGKHGRVARATWNAEATSVPPW